MQPFRNVVFAGPQGRTMLLLSVLAAHKQMEIENEDRARMAKLTVDQHFRARMIFLDLERETL